MSTTPTGAKCKTSASKRSDGNIKDNERIYFFPDICIFQHTIVTQECSLPGVPLLAS